MLTVVVALFVAAGLIGAVVQVVPGGVVVGLAVAVWGGVTGGALGWSVATFALAVTAVAIVLKYLLAGRYLKRQGVPSRSLVVGALVGVVGFFLIPFVGLIVGFVGGTYVAEWQRLGQHQPAWAATVAAMRAAGLSILIELAGALIVTVVWVGAAVAQSL